jgi:hypothetical protein
VTVTALALESGGEQAVLVSCDRVSVPTVILNRVCEAVVAWLPAFDPSKLFMTCTHTHTAPEILEGFYPVDDPAVMTPSAYADFFVEHAAECIARAWKRREEGGISRAFGYAVIGHNRRVSYKDGHAQMYGTTDRPDFECIEGYEDHSVDMLFTWDEMGKLTGVVVDVPCPSQEVESAYYVSADFWHDAREEIKKRCGANVNVLALCGAGGDQSPHLQIYRKQEDERLRRAGLSMRQEIGQRIADAVSEVLDGAAKEIMAEPVLKHLVRTIDMPLRMVTEAEYEKASREYAEMQANEPDPADANAVSYRVIISGRCMDVMDRHNRQKEGETKPVEIHALRIGDLAMATNPFELYLDYGLRIKARSKAEQTVIVQLTASRAEEVVTYLPTARAVEGQGYGAEIPDGIFGPEGGQVLVEETLRMIDEMWE